MRRPRAVRFFAFAPVRHRCGRAAQVCPYGCGALRRFYKFHFIQKLRAEGVFRELAKCPARAKSCDTCDVAFPAVGCLFTPQVAVCAIVKNVADAIFNRGLQLICLYTMSAPRVFSVNLQNAPLGQSRAIPAPWRFPAVGCLFTPQVAVCAIVKKMSQTLILNC